MSAAKQSVAALAATACAMPWEDKAPFSTRYEFKEAVTPEMFTELLEALRACLTALNAIGDEMTVGERYTNAGQYLIDALQPARDAIAKAEAAS